jgi:SAM-dependent methyltransferase
MSKRLSKSRSRIERPGRKSSAQELKLEQYSPFAGLKGFFLASDKSGARFVLSKDPEYSIQIRPKGYTPKSGILLCKYLTKLANNKKVLDIGTGEGGLLAIHAAKSGARSVVAIDINRQAIIWANKNINLNKLRNIHLSNGDVYPKTNSRFDLIVSNPPQMPMERGAHHDSGGADGRKIIMSIIKGASSRLNKNGAILLLLFDFLGVTERYGIQPTLKDILLSEGFRLDVLGSHERVVRKEGKTLQSLKSILKSYPKFRFRVKGQKLVHQVLIVLAKKIP